MSSKLPRVSCTCPVCGDVFTLNQSEYRKYEKIGLLPCCCRSHGNEYRRIRKAEAA